MIRTRVSSLRRTTGARLVAIVMLALAASSARAADGPKQVMTKTIDAAFTILKDRTLAGKERRPQRIAELRRVAELTFDWSELARSTLGVKWRSLDESRWFCSARRGLTRNRQE